ncbi:diacylglycerol kinase [Streptomyces gobiensis]|uniref:diacylglycerol kinase n=1 Tax=Streptomyces gobiensis TaxID=2875706 RepID=UPI001E523B5C|nr:diacylglycerol kinase [Streptomyces gobiensis]UGY92725.1 diacylglycerol kinase [Streptomyces gobiensis]
MSAPDLLVVVDPAARRIDGESVRIAKDVLCAGAPGAKVCLPEGREDVARALARRGSRQPVVVGDDRALLCAVELLHRDRALADAALAVVPVGAAGAVALAHGLGVPLDVVTAARAVLAGVERRLDLLVDDCDAVVLGGLRIPAARKAPGQPGQPGHSGPPGVRGALSRCASLVRPSWPPSPLLPRLRVEADGVVLAEPGSPVAEVSVSTQTGGAGGGLADVVVRRAAVGFQKSGSSLVRARARAVTVSGPDFHPRTWTVAPSALRLTVPGS